MYFYVGVLCLSLFVMHYFIHSSFVIIWTRKRELVALLSLSFRCLVTGNVLWIFLTVLWICMQFVIVLFPDLTHLRFSSGEFFK